MQTYTLLYVRKSTDEDDRQILSLDAQERECRSYAGQNGLIIDELVRESHSARKPGRPLFQQMVARTEDLRRQGRMVRVLCHKPDRLLRNLGDWARINDLMDAGVECVFVTGTYPNNAQGKMAFGINVLFAKYYVDNLSEEVRKGMLQKVIRGELPGKAPLGYLNIEKKIAMDPATAPIVRRAFEYYSTGEYSLNALRQQLHAEGLKGKQGGKMLAKGILRDHILSNHFYMGLLRYRGELHPGSHEPLVSPALFGRVQEVLSGKVSPKRIRHNFRFGGMFRCVTCNGAVLGDVKKGRYIYYRCGHQRGDCSEGYIRQECLEAILGEAVSRRLTLPADLAEVLRVGAEMAMKEEEREKQGRVALEGHVRAIQKKLDTLLDIRLVGHIGEEEYLSKKEELLLNLTRANEALALLELPSRSLCETVEWFVGLCNNLGSRLAELPDREARELLRIVGSNYVYGGKNVDFEPVKPFDLASQNQNRPVWSGYQDDTRTFTSMLQNFSIQNPHITSLTWASLTEG